MDLYPSIFTRASTRAFDPAPLPGGTLKALGAFLAGVKPPLPGAAFTRGIAGPVGAAG